MQNNLDSLDIDEPRDQVWQNIRRESQGQQKPSVIRMVTRWAVAACVIALAGVGAWSILHTSDNKQGELAVAPPKTSVDTQGSKANPSPAETAAVQPEVEKATEAETVTAPKTQLANNHTKERKPNRLKQAQDEQQAINNQQLAALQNIENSFTQVINLQRDRVSSMPMFAESPEYFKDFKIQIRQMEKDEKAIKSDIAKRGMNDELLDQLINLYQQKLNTLKQLQTEMNKTNNRYKQNHAVVDPAKTYFLNL